MEAFAYASGTVPADYKCGTCGATGCKLWREYSTFLDHQTLECCDCAGKSQSKDVSHIASDGSISHEFAGQVYSIGWRVLAVPTEDGDTYWGYTSIPESGLVWWRALPTRAK